MSTNTVSSMDEVFLQQRREEVAQFKRNLAKHQAEEAACVGCTKARATADILGKPPCCSLHRFKRKRLAGF